MEKNYFQAFNVHLYEPFLPSFLFQAKLKE